MPTDTATSIAMPQLGESVTEGTIGTWLKQVGDRVEKYEPLVEVETDKVNTELPAPVAGVLVEILVDSETTVPVGTELCRIDEALASSPPRPLSISASSAPSAPSAPSETDVLRVRSSPVVRRIAEEHGVDISQIEGTGIGGRVTKQDLLAYLEVTPAAAVTVTPPQPAPEPVPALQPEPRPAPERTPVQLFPGDEVVPVTPIRRLIAEHMVRSERTAPHATVVMEVDMTNVVAYRAVHRHDFLRQEGIALTYLPFAVKAATLALREHPRLNAVWDEDRIVHRKAINIGVAVALEDGLIVPVVKHADRLSLAGLAHAVAEIAAKARAGTLTPDDVSGGTFTVNNPGTFGSLVSTPILVQPQVAILSTEAIVKRPVVIDDMIAVRSMMNLSLSIDHRALDGLAATRFLQTVKTRLENMDERLDLG